MAGKAGPTTRFLVRKVAKYESLTLEIELLKSELAKLRPPSLKCSRESHVIVKNLRQRPPRQSMPQCPHEPIICINPRYFRPTEVETLLGDPTKAKQKLGWVPEITLDQMAQEKGPMI
jgi:GDP-D-mannose dehydratase